MIKIYFNPQQSNIKFSARATLKHKIKPLILKQIIGLSTYPHAAKQLKEKLSAAGLEVWLDLDELKPGDSWQATLEKALSDCDALVVYVGTGGVQNWVDMEVRTAIDRFVTDKEKNFRVIPCCGPDVDPGDLPAFLRSFQAVKLTDGFLEAKKA